MVHETTVGYRVDIDLFAVIVGPRDLFSDSFSRVYFPTTGIVV
ncbi:hypothetical protein [Pseudovibrio sp. Tun.PSC04-5.I4]|nr:hypothetical protein [Pseudovibrio sp. Tun.PSC04-5.I4]